MEITAYRLGDLTGWSLEPASAQRDWMDETIGRRAYRCLPLSIANQCGWVVRGPHTFGATWTGGAEGSATHITPIDVQPRFDDHIHTNFGLGIISFALPWLFRTPPGYGILVTGALNTSRLHTAPLSGVIETDWAPYSFTMNWRILVPNVQVKFHRDDPICVLIPFHLDALDQMSAEMKVITEEPELKAAHDEWSRERRADNERNRDLPLEEQKYSLKYLRGVTMSGEREASHRSKLKLPAFTGISPRWPKGEPADRTATPPPASPAAPGGTSPTPPPPAPQAPPAGGVTPERIFASPELYLTDFDPASGRTVLARMSRQTYNESPALDHRMSSLGPPVYQATMMGMMQMRRRFNPPAQPAHIVVRSAGVQTFSQIAALDPIATVYREPLVLTRVADMKRQALAGQPASSVTTWEDALDVLQPLYARRWQLEEQSVVLAADAGMVLIEDFLAAHGDARATVLWMPLHRSLGALLGAPDLRQRAARAAADARRLEGFAGVDTAALSDLQCATFLWCVQMRQLEEACAAHGSRLLPVDASTLNAQAIQELAKHLGLATEISVGAPLPPGRPVTDAVRTEADQFAQSLCPTGVPDPAQLY